MTTIKNYFSYFWLCWEIGWKLINNIIQRESFKTWFFWKAFSKTADRYNYSFFCFFRTHHVESIFNSCLFRFASTYSRYITHNKHIHDNDNNQRFLSYLNASISQGILFCVVPDSRSFFALRNISFFLHDWLVFFRSHINHIYLIDNNKQRKKHFSKVIIIVHSIK